MKYKTLGMLKAGGFQKDLNDHLAGAGTTYLLSRQRDPYRVEVQAGLLVLLQSGGFHAFDTTSGLNQTYIFVMTGDGQIYSGDKQEVMHHSSFLAGREVAAAGSWIVRSGRVTMITDLSGHYQTPTDYVEQVLTEIKSRGVNISNVVRRWTGASSEKMAKALTSVGHQRERIGNTGFEPTKY
jgi:hypothetical protein